MLQLQCEGLRLACAKRAATPRATRAIVRSRSARGRSWAGSVMVFAVSNARPEKRRVHSTVPGSAANTKGSQLKPRLAGCLATLRS